MRVKEDGDPQAGQGGARQQARAIEIRGTAELHDTGGEKANPRFSTFAPQFVRIRPTRIVAWGIEEAAAGTDYQVNARSVR